jgi:hypothetical protein
MTPTVSRKRKVDEIVPLGKIIKRNHCPVRSVRFDVDDTKHENCLIEYKIKRLKMLVRRQRNRTLNSIVQNDQWLSTKEIKALHIDCARTVQRMERGDLTSEDDVTSLSRYSTDRIARKMIVRNQLHDTINAIHSFEMTTGKKVPDLMARACQQLTHHTSQTAYLDALKMHVEVLRYITASL